MKLFFKNKSRIFQCIPLNLKCDMRSDCQDETDESQCKCADYLEQFNQTLVNDGHVDCWDYSDEQDYCTSITKILIQFFSSDRLFGVGPCPIGQFYSQLTDECHGDVSICDHFSQTPYSEDELNCGNEIKMIPTYKTIQSNHLCWHSGLNKSARNDRNRSDQPTRSPAIWCHILVRPAILALYLF